MAMVSAAIATTTPIPPKMRTNTLARDMSEASATSTCAPTKSGSLTRSAASATGRTHVATEASTTAMASDAVTRHASDSSVQVANVATASTPNHSETTSITALRRIAPIAAAPTASDVTPSIATSPQVGGMKPV
jgi:hypothetical protein